MGKFIDSLELLSELCSIVKRAKQEILIVCPFIELHHNFKRCLRTHLDNPALSIIILYGKYSNKDHYKLSDDDLEFLKPFPNIRIFYHERLHAKFYANEVTALVTSLNLSHNSSNNNLEYGILLNEESDSVAVELRKFINDLICESQLIYQNVPERKPLVPITSITDKIDRIKIEYPNAYEKWSEADDNMLEILFCEGKSSKELSIFFKRQPGAINSRINKLELHEKYGI